MIEEKAFVEHAKFGGNRYGTSKRTIGELTASGRVVVLDIEMEVCFFVLLFAFTFPPLCYILLLVQGFGFIGVGKTWTDDSK